MLEKVVVKSYFTFKKLVSIFFKTFDYVVLNYHNFLSCYSNSKSVMVEIVDDLAFTRPLVKNFCDPKILLFFLHYVTYLPLCFFGCSILKKKIFFLEGKIICLRNRQTPFLKHIIKILHFEKHRYGSATKLCFLENKVFSIEKCKKTFFQEY